MAPRAGAGHRGRRAQHLGVEESRLGAPEAGARPADASAQPKANRRRDMSQSRGTAAPKRDRETDRTTLPAGFGRYPAPPRRNAANGQRLIGARRSTPAAPPFSRHPSTHSRRAAIVSVHGDPLPPRRHSIGARRPTPAALPLSGAWRSTPAALPLSRRPSIIPRRSVGIRPYPLPRIGSRNVIHRFPPERANPAVRPSPPRAARRGLSCAGRRRTQIFRRLYRRRIPARQGILKGERLWLLPPT